MTLLHLSERLWVCHECEMIGGQAEAERHVEQKNHRVDQLDQETSDAVRAEWMKEATRYDSAIAATLLSAPRVTEVDSPSANPGSPFGV